MWALRRRSHLSLKIVEGPVQLMPCESLSSKILAAAADVAQPMWTSLRGGAKRILRRLWMERKASLVESCARACQLMLAG